MDQPNIFDRLKKNDDDKKYLNKVTEELINELKHSLRIGKRYFIEAIEPNGNAANPFRIHGMYLGEAVGTNYGEFLVYLFPQKAYKVFQIEYSRIFAEVPEINKAGWTIKCSLVRLKNESS